MNKKTKTNKLNYISLFSSAGIGCYGFKQAGFDCIATCELLEKRLNVQKVNNKCKFNSGYICGDITKSEISRKIFDEIKKWKDKKLITDVDVIVATPPCQGMSVANQKKSNELCRNSLVVSAIKLIRQIKPKIFIFENVPRFLKTACVGLDRKSRLISDEIDKDLGRSYYYLSKVMNFKNYGSNSSRTRTIVIGVRQDYIDLVAPFELFPSFSNSKTLKQVIGKFPSLKNMNDFDNKNPLHHFKKYGVEMRKWIHDLKQGESAMDNEDTDKKPHRIINGKIVFAKAIFGDKYKRQIWDKEAPCVHTANGCLASQNTIHPVDDRVFTIAELMEMMSIPKSFKWDKNNLKKMSKNEIINWLNKNENNIRECIGEAVPTGVFAKIAKNIKSCLLSKNNLYECSKKFENNNSFKEENAAFYTTRINLTQIYNLLPNFNKKEISILEPSVGVGNFLLPIIKKYESYNHVSLTLVDIDKEAIKNLKLNINKLKIPKNFSIKIMNSDFLMNNNNLSHFDLVIGNPPFKKLDKKVSLLTSCKNTFELFWKKALLLADCVIMISPKLLLSSPTYKEFRKFLSNKNITDIVDFGELGFADVKIETITIKVCNNSKSKQINVYSVPKNKKMLQDKKYIFDQNLPYWIIYRDQKFDEIYFKMKKDIFSIYKNYEISNSKLTKKSKNLVWVIRSKNIDISKPGFVHISNYDKYAKADVIKATKFYKFINSAKKELFLLPTLTYYPRVVKMPKNVFVNGSVLVAQLKDPNIVIRDKDIEFFYSDEFREFYSIAFNYATRTLNIDNETIKFFGVMK